MGQQDGRISRKRGRRIACRPCRQAKIRCELSTGGNTPCSRCRRLEEDCAIDTEFKRVNKRDHMEALEREVEQLRSSVSLIPTSTPQFVHDQSPVNLSHVETPSKNLAANLTSTVQYENHVLSPNLHPASTPRSLKYLQLTSQQIDSLFHIFFTKFHRYIMLLDLAVSPDEYYNRCPLLFWAIIYIASRQFTDEPNLFTALAAPLKGLLWEAISNPPHTPDTVRSMLLLCMWPFPTSSLSTDITPMLVTLSQTIAMQLGLHQPDAIQDFSRKRRRLRPAEASEMVKTWSTCYIAAQNLSSIHGQTPMFSDSSNATIDRVCNENIYAVPDSMKHQLLICRFSARVNSYMSNSFSGAGLPHDSMSLLSLLEQEFIDLSAKLCSQLTVEDEILLNGTGLQLYVFYLLHPEGPTARKIGLLRAFDLAVSVTSKLENLDTSLDFMKYCPGAHHRTTCLAAIFILKLLDSNYSHSLDVESGRHAFHAALGLIRRSSSEDNDLPARTSKILAQLWHGQNHFSRKNQEPKLKLRTRLAASLLHDSLWDWRERFGGQRSASHTPSSDPIGDPLDREMWENCAQFAHDGGGFDRLSFEDVLDVDMMSLLAFDPRGDASFNPAA